MHGYALVWMKMAQCFGETANNYINARLGLFISSKSPCHHTHSVVFLLDEIAESLLVTM